jgi:hypothetical protein
MLKSSHQKWPTLPEPFKQFVLYLSKIFPSLPLLLQSTNEILDNYSDMYECAKMFTDIQEEVAKLREFNNLKCQNDFDRKMYHHVPQLQQLKSYGYLKE